MFSGHLQARAALTPLETASSTYRVGGWMGTTFGLETVADDKKNLLLPKRTEMRVLGCQSHIFVIKETKNLLHRNDVATCQKH
jgi:hypothetical protein